jgi:2-C-methyl-D-erythritol 4-phosphate cytidylyltransferase
MKVFVIIPAAGLGTRMSAGARKGPRPSKQFTELGGAPILIHTLRKFAASGQVSEIYVALRKNEMEAFRRQLDKEGLKKPVHIVEGGEHRQESVANALRALPAKDDDIVLVHDAVRPFIEVDTIHGVIVAARKSGAAIAGVPAVDTIKKVEPKGDAAVITLTIPREQVVMAQTPQGALYRVMRKAFDEAAADGFTGTDEASLIERSGHEVMVVMGSARNIKITTPADMELAEFFLSQKKG